MASVSFMYAECMLEVWMKYRRGYSEVSIKIIATSIK
jgi:hypothetical protein